MSFGIITKSSPEAEQGSGFQTGQPVIRELSGIIEGGKFILEKINNFAPRSFI